MLSLIIPIFNRPDELNELLSSLVAGRVLPDEVVVVEDGSSVPSDGVVDAWSNQLNIKYLTQQNGGPASARNYGASVAEGDFLVILDSDTIIPTDYIANIEHHIACGVRFWGGADSAAADFSTLQKAINYSMTSLFTTGGIRGKRRSLGSFTPRSFNMGIESSLFEAVGGFNSTMRGAHGEDIDFSLRVMALGVEAVFLPDVVVFHKRRNNYGSFFRQVYRFGGARIDLNRRYPESRRLVYALPALFTVGSIILIISALWFWWSILPLMLLMLIWFIDATLRNRSVLVGVTAVMTSFIQLYGYGFGYLVAMAG